MKYCNCHNRRRNPNSMDFVIDYYHMLDALRQMLDVASQASDPFSSEFEELYTQLNTSGPQVQAREFSQIFAGTVAPSGQEPTFTELYEAIRSARLDPADPVNAAILNFVTKARRIIQTFDFGKARNTQSLTIKLMEMRRFVTDMLQEAYAAQVQLDADALEALQNMERWKSSMGTLDPHRLSLHTLNNFIGLLQPTQPFGLSVYHIYRHIDPASAQQKAMEFSTIIGEVSDLINPFTQELAANDELTGWRYLHVPVTP